MSECPDQVRITLGQMQVSNGMVTISFSHNGHGCPAARPTGGSLARTGNPVALSFGIAALLLIAGASLMVWSGRPRRH